MYLHNNILAVLNIIIHKRELIEITGRVQQITNSHIVCEIYKNLYKNS